MGRSIEDRAEPQEPLGEFFYVFTLLHTHYFLFNLLSTISS